MPTRSPNLLHLGDQVQCLLPWGHTPFPVIVRGFHGNSVHVEAAERSEDWEVENEWIVGFDDLHRGH